MAGIDTSIYNQLLRPPKSVAEFDQEALATQANRLALQSQQEVFADKARAIADGNKLRQVVSGFGSDVSANKQALLSAGRLDDALKYEKTNLESDKLRKDALHIDAQTGELTQKTSAAKYDLERKKHDVAISEITSFRSPADAIASLERHIATGDMSPQEGAQIKANIPTDPAQFRQWQMQGVQSILSAKDRMEYLAPNANTVANNDQSNTNSIRTAASAKYSADSSASTARRGQDLTENRLRNEPKGVIVQTETGPILVDPRFGTSKPVLDGLGAPVEAKLKPLPAQVQKGLMENSSALRKVEAALAAVADYPDALGTKNYLGDSIRQRSDPKGINARALVADIGSLKIHDRSGAAVTASETPRLMPFIPSATDDPETVKKKLGLFKDEYNAVESEIRDSYSREQGYKLPPESKKATPVKPTTTVPSKNVKGWTLHTDAKGNKAYVSPDGKNYEEVP